jgi:formiminoglutamate deiminase
MRIFSKRALLVDGWAHNAALTIENGAITNIEVGAQLSGSDVTVDTLLPALSNLHSHTFQRAMAGMTEYRAKEKESFWTWRDLMYRYLDKMAPEHFGAVAELAFMEMLEAGYAAVGEFHYVHHMAGGAPYDDLGELSARVMAAAKETGIGLTLLPVLYTYGSVKGSKLVGGQLRFGNSVDRFCRLVERCQELSRDMSFDTSVGIAPHSLRATNPTDLTEVLTAFPEGPVHIHIAEQTREVEDVQATLGARPVEWLLANVDVDRRWCLVHATHMTDEEVLGLAQSGAVAGLCPVTEANLGDGVFPGPGYLEAGGTFGVGTDSNINISVSEELRTLEYSQRLLLRERNVMVKGDGSTGLMLYTHAANGGAQAIDRNSGAIKEGTIADLVAINGLSSRLCMLDDHQLLDGLVFASSDNVITDVWAAGRHLVQDGRHIARDRISEGCVNRPGFTGEFLVQ